MWYTNVAPCHIFAVNSFCGYSITGSWLILPVFIGIIVVMLLLCFF